VLVPFDKPTLSLDEQLKWLTSRGLVIADSDKAVHALQHIGFFRLNCYTEAFQQPSKTDFYPGTKFEDVLDRYVFDRKLRLLIMDAIERIEIAARSLFTNSVATRHGAHWYLNPALFQPNFWHTDFITDIKRQIGHDPQSKKRRDTFVERYYNTYNSPDMPPAWMIFEVVNFGTMSIALKNIVHLEHAEICKAFGQAHGVLSSWMHSLSYIRNLCAHHARVWNRICTIKPMAARAYKSDLDPTNRTYAQLVVMQLLLGKIEPSNHWAERLSALLDEHPDIPLQKIGFPANWRARPLWKLTKTAHS
jgi:abortive infection bacteriophage resistance protein